MDCKEKIGAFDRLSLKNLGYFMRVSTASKSLIADLPDDSNLLGLDKADCIIVNS